jgi:hypothetical protein
MGGEKKFNLGKIAYQEARKDREADDHAHWQAAYSPIKAYHYPFCCTGVVLANLGGSEDSFGAIGNIQKIKEQLKAWIDAIEDGCINGYDKEFITAITTKEQEIANYALEQLGFEQSNRIKNTVNDYDLYHWVLPLSGFVEGE